MNNIKEVSENLFGQMWKPRSSEHLKKCKKLMIRRFKGRVILLALSMVIFICLTSFVRSKPKILIIGDSISIGYTPFVQQHFADMATVIHNPGNAQHTGTGLKNIEQWVAREDWDIIQFNWGLWDLCYRDPTPENQFHRDKVNGKVTYTVEDYAANLDTLVTFLENETNAKLIFVTTTYVPENEPGRFQGDVIKYNNAAKKVMEEHSITVNDIYEQSIPIHEKYGKGSDNVHYSQEGYKAIGRLIINFLEMEIGSPDDDH